jgi:hypothetical protein
MDQHDIDNRFAYHQPGRVEVAQQCDAIRAAMKDAAHELNDIIGPDVHTREVSTAITKLEEACQWAIAAVVRHQ